jgi:hypothetical protein
MIFKVRIPQNTLMEDIIPLVKYVYLKFLFTGILCTYIF